MSNLVHQQCFTSKSFEYWKHLYDKGIIKSHAIKLQLAHLKYAGDQNLISNEEYYVHRIRITDQYNPSSNNYKPSTLLDFVKALKTYNSTSKLEINRPLKINQHSDNKTYKVHKNTRNTFERINKQNNIILDLNENRQKKEKNITQKKKAKKSRKKRKSKKRRNYIICKDFINNVETTIKENVNGNCFNTIENSLKPILVSNPSVKIFVRKMNKKYKYETNNKNSFVSNKISVRDIFSKILKQFKKERQLQC